MNIWFLNVHVLINIHIFFYNILQGVLDFELDSDILDSEDENLGLLAGVNAVEESQ